MEYPEFSKYKSIEDPSTPAKCFIDDEGNTFYVEPGFYFELVGFKDKVRERFPELIDEIGRIIKKNHKVIFTANFEAPFLEKEGYVYKEITDISDPLGIFFEDKSRGSDYGD